MKPLSPKRRIAGPSGLCRPLLETLRDREVDQIFLWRKMLQIFFYFVIMRYFLSNFQCKNELNPFRNKGVAYQNAEKVKGCEYFPDSLYAVFNLAFGGRVVSGQHHRK